MKQRKPIISIVVPVYKVEDYLEKCVYSLINQTYSQIEIILVDDGSPDNCPEICDRFAEKDFRVKVIHKENGGLSDARNVGIKAAIGEYVLFVDSDDYIELDSCVRFIKVIDYHKPDVVVGNARRIEDESISIMHHHYVAIDQMITGKHYLKKELESDTMYMAAWLNLYNRNFLLNNGLEFKVGLLHEDEEFTPRVFLKAEKVIGTDIVFYNYIIRNGSITTKKDLSRNGIHIIRTCYELAEIYKDINDQSLKQLLNDNLVTKYLYGFQMGALYRKEYKDLLNKTFIWRLSAHRKTKIKVLLFCFNNRIYYILNRLAKSLNLRSIR